MKREHSEVATEGQSSRVSQDKQSTHSLSNSRPAEVDRNSVQADQSDHTPKHRRLELGWFHSSLNRV